MSIEVHSGVHGNNNNDIKMAGFKKTQDFVYSCQPRLLSHRLPVGRSEQQWATRLNCIEMPKVRNVNVFIQMVLNALLHLFASQKASHVRLNDFG